MVLLLWVIETKKTVILFSVYNIRNWPGFVDRKKCRVVLILVIDGTTMIYWLLLDSGELFERRHDMTLH